MAHKSITNGLIDRIERTTQAHSVTLEPGWTGHDGPDHLRILAPMASAKKNSNCKSANIERNDAIRRLRAEGASLDALMQMYGLTRHSLHQIIGERE
jgi:hypothetical protein